MTCTIHFGHLQTIDSGVLQQEILSSEDRISDSVMTQSDFEVEYVGAPIIEGEFLITLKGVPSGGLIMNPLQKRYFEKVTSEFFNKFSKVPVYHVEVTNEVPEGGVNGVDGEQEILEGAKEQESERRLHRQLGRSSTTMDFHTNASGRQLQNHIYLRRSNNSRNLQEGETQVVTKFYGAGTDSDLRNGIFEVAITNEEQFLKELSLQQLRPGEINKEDSGSHFANLVGIVVGPVPADFNKPGTVAGGITDTENQYQLYMYICYGGMAFSALWLVYRFYKDCCYSSKPGMESIPKHDPKEGVRSRFRPGLSFKRNNNRPGRPTDSDKTSPPPPVPQRRPSFDKFLPEEKFQQANYWSGLFGKKKDDDGIVDDNRSMENSKGASKTRGGCVPKTPIQRSKSFDGVFGKKKGDEPKPVDNSKTTFSSTGKKLVKDDEKRAPATNKAGQNGRGVLPSRSLPTFLRPSNPDIKQLKPSTTKAKKTANDKSLSSNQAGIKTKKNVGSNEKKKGNPAKNGSGKKGAGKKKKVGAASGKKRAKNPSAKNPANAKNLPDFNKEAKEKKISRKNNVGGSPKSNLVEKKERLAENGKLENSLVKKDEDAKNGKANPKRSPKNQAGQKRGIQKSKSLPMEKKLAVARDWSSSEEDLSSNESESSDNSPKNVLANKKKQVKTKTETHAEDWSSSESSGDESGFSNEETDAPESSKDDSSSEESSGVADSDSESNSESEPSAETSNLADGETDCSEGEDGTITNTPRSKQSLSSKKRGNETEGRSIASKNPQFSKKSPASNQRGRRVRGVDASKSMPVMKRAPSRPSFYDSYSSEESDFEEKADPNWGSMASIEPEDLPKKHGQYNASYQEIDKGLVGRAAKKKIAPKKHAPYSSSDEEIDQGYGAKKKTAPKKHVPYSSSDEEIEKGYGAKKRIRPKKHHSFSKSLSDDEMTKSKFIYPNKHLPRSLSDDESSAKKEPVTKSQSGTKRGVSASKSTPFQHKYPVQKNLVAPKRILPQKHRSFNKSLSDDEITEPKFIHPNKHFPRSLSDDESPAKKGPVAKNQSGMRGRGVSASKSMPFQQKHPVKETTAYGNTKNNLVAPKRIPPNRSKSSEFEKKQPPKRTNSKEFGKFGKIKFQPRK